MSETTEITLAFIASEIELSNKIAWYQVDPKSKRGQRLRRQIEAEMDRWEMER